VWEVTSCCDPNSDWPKKGGARFGIDPSGLRQKDAPKVANLTSAAVAWGIYLGTVQPHHLLQLYK
jgi:hypothetical protein